MKKLTLKEVKKLSDGTPIYISAFKYNGWYIINNTYSMIPDYLLNIDECGKEIKCVSVFNHHDVGCIYFTDKSYDERWTAYFYEDEVS